MQRAKHFIGYQNLDADGNLSRNHNPGIVMVAHRHSMVSRLSSSFILGSNPWKVRCAVCLRIQRHRDCRFRKGCDRRLRGAAHAPSVYQPRTDRPLRPTKIPGEAQSLECIQVVGVGGGWLPTFLPTS